MVSGLTPSDRCPRQGGPSSAAASRARASAAGAKRATIDRVRRPKTPTRALRSPPRAPVSYSSTLPRAAENFKNHQKKCSQGAAPLAG
eukprot:5620586-Prymnesium_polylepis.1